MHGRTIGVQITGGDMVELYITGDSARRVIVDVAPVVDLDRGDPGRRDHVLGRGTGSAVRVARFGRVRRQMQRRSGATRRRGSDALADQIAKLTALLDRIGAALGVQRALRRRRRSSPSPAGGRGQTR